MSLEEFRRPRLIVLHPEATAYEAARAMVDNHVGALLVSREGKVVGIVTDRDLACEVVAAGLDPARTLLGDILSEEVAAADIGADVSAVLDLMSKHACRRVPVLEHGKAVGLVTLDDLLLMGAIDAHAAAEVIRAQLETPSRYKRAGAVHPETPARPEVAPRGARALTRRSARAATSYARLLEAVQRRAGLTERPRAELALKIVLGTLCRRVTPEEARHFLAQLPSTLKDELGAHLDGPNRQLTRETLERELEAVLGLNAMRAGGVAEGVSEAIGESISEGQLEAMKGQLPKEMKELFTSRNGGRRRAVE